MKRNKNKKGFTIVELVIVIGVIGILSAILIPTFVSLTTKAETAALKSNLANAYSMYAADAADRKSDKEPAKDIEFKAQSEVALKNGAKWYTYAANEWNEYTPESTSIPTTLVVAGDENASTFGGYIFYVKK